MLVEKCKLWNDDNPAVYTKYLMDNSTEIELDRKHPAIVVCGGGGYIGISDREKEPVALYYLGHGFQAFVLDYNTQRTGNGNYPIPVYDLAKMVLTIRQNAEKWNIDPEKIAVIGFSAGGHLCASLATQWHEKYLSEKLQVNSKLLKPNAAILSYPVTDYVYQSEQIELDKTTKESCPSLGGLTKCDFVDMANKAAIGENIDEKHLIDASPYYHITPNVPPIFIWYTATDELVYPGQTLMFAKKLGENGVPYELHGFEEGAHGMSLAAEVSSGTPDFVNEDVAEWKQLSIRFLNRHFKKPN